MSIRLGQDTEIAGIRLPAGLPLLLPGEPDPIQAIRLGPLRLWRIRPDRRWHLSIAGKRMLACDRDGVRVGVR